MASQMETDDDVLGELIKTCDDRPADGLAWVDGLNDELRGHKVVMFARLIALRKLAFSKLFAFGVETLDGQTDSSLLTLFGEQELKWVRAAVDQVADIERRHPGYVEEIGTPKDPWAVRIVDDVCTVVERVDPGAIQATLGWTKLRYFGRERIGLLPGFEPDAGLISNLMEVRFSAEKIARSAIGTYSITNQNGANGVSFALCRLDYHKTADVGSADNFGTAYLYEDGSAEYHAQIKSHPPTGEAASEMARRSHKGRTGISPNVHRAVGLIGLIILAAVVISIFV